MTDSPFFPDRLRSEYDARVMDAEQREAKARQLQSAFQAAQLWKPPASILDVGCGSGLLLAAIDAPQAFRVGCDVRSALFQSSGLERSKIIFVQADAAAPPFNRRQFDLVMCLAAIGEFPDWRMAMQMMGECVAPGGILYVTITNGPLLLPLYALLEKMGRRVSEGEWRYARSTIRFQGHLPEKGFGVNALDGWSYLNVTPFLARAQFPLLRLVPFSMLETLTKFGSPSWGHAWRKPVE